MQTIDSLFVPDLQPALKHPTVFKKFDSLLQGEAFLLVNDHNPIPLFYQLKAERGDVFEWVELEGGPEVWKIKITKTGDVADQGTPQPTAAKEVSNATVLNVTLLEPRQKHPTIFRHFDALAEGETVEILNDHDPKPLYYQLLGERGAIFSWTYLQSGPQWWRVQITKNEMESKETVGQIAASDLRKAEVFKKFGIDFCCGGKKTLKQVCAEKGLNLAAVEAELAAPSVVVNSSNAYQQWAPDFLADYIYNQHHLYYYNTLPVLSGLMTKVSQHHGGNYPELELLDRLFTKLVEELDAHFAKEEKVVFPFIKALVQAKRTGSFEALQTQPSLTEPIRLMEEDHESAGELLETMQQLTNGYTVPEGACNSFQFLYKKLKELDEDLHQHVHLENNLLFPKALQLEKELRTAKSL